MLKHCGANGDGKMLASFYPPRSKIGIYFLLDPTNNHIRRTNKTSKKKMEEWPNITQQEFCSGFCDGNCPVLSRITINGRYLSDFKRKYYLSIIHCYSR